MVSSDSPHAPPPTVRASLGRRWGCHENEQSLSGPVHSLCCGHLGARWAETSPGPQMAHTTSSPGMRHSIPSPAGRGPQRRVTCFGAVLPNRRKARWSPALWGVAKLGPHSSQAGGTHTSPLCWGRSLAGLGIQPRGPRELILRWPVGKENSVQT